MPGREQPLVNGVTFRLEAGEALGVVGPSGAGKTTLARILVGVLPPTGGEIRIDGAKLDQWAPHELAHHIGYLPQAVDLFDGTVAENIARFAPDATSEEVICAARDARAHDMILGLPKGYETPVGEAGNALSAGQRQRVGLARALFRQPFLIVLDEPNSNIDGEGREGLMAAIAAARARGAIVVVLAHAPAVVKATSQILVLIDGRQQEWGATEDILPKIVVSSVQGAQKAA